MGVHFERGQVLFSMGRYREAAKEYLAELAEEPEDVPSLINLAASYNNCGDFVAAKSAVSQAIARAPEHPHAHYVLSSVLTSAGKLRLAHAAILEAIRLQPTAGYFVALARLYEHEGRYAQSHDASTKALALDPTYLPAILLQGQNLLRIGRVEEANELFAAALRESPDESAIHQAMGRMKLSQGNASVALAFLTEARRLDPLYFNDWKAIAEAYGLGLRGIRSLSRIAPRWYNWPFRWQWLLSIFLTSAFALVSMEINILRRDPSIEAAFRHRWWLLFCIILANYLLLPYTFSLIARSIACIVAKGELDTRWYSLLLQPVNLLWVIGLHVLVTFVAAIGSVAPELAAGLIAMWSSFPLVAAAAKRWPNGVVSLICIPVLVLLSALILGGVATLSYEKDYWAFFYIGLFFTLTYFSERVTRWVSSL